MPPSGPVADFSADIARQLRFDPQLARRVRAEVEDHLSEAMAARGEAACADAQRQAIAAFGDAHEIARAFMPSALQSLSRRTAVLTALAVIGIFLVMLARFAWFRWVGWPVGETARAAGAIGLPVDRLAFAIAFGFALAALIYAMTRRAPPNLHAGFGREIRRAIALGAIAVLALFTAIATELILTGIRLAETDIGSSALVPALSLALEAAVAAGATAYLGLALRRLSLALQLARPD
jgi:hypothetical protein